MLYRQRKTQERKHHIFPIPPINDETEINKKKIGINKNRKYGIYNVNFFFYRASLFTPKLRPDFGVRSERNTRYRTSMIYDTTVIIL